MAMNATYAEWEDSLSEETYLNTYLVPTGDENEEGTYLAVTDVHDIDGVFQTTNSLSITLEQLEAYGANMTQMQDYVYDNVTRARAFQETIPKGMPPTASEDDAEKR